MKVSDNVKSAYESGSITKHVTLSFPELDVEISTGQIDYETMQLSESILESDSIEFVGCIASKFSIQMHGLKADIKGKKIAVTICTDGTEDEPVNLFSGIVDTVTMQANKQIKEIVAYDVLYTKGNMDVATWYNALTFPISLLDLRNSLFEYLDINQVEVSLPNDAVVITKQYAPATLQAINVIKAICQINGAFGAINREGIFEYRILTEIQGGEGAYPGLTLFPPFYPGTGDTGSGDYTPVSISYYKSVDYEEYSVKPVDRLTIRQSDGETGVSCGTGDNNYIIQGNMFTYGKTAEELLQIAQNIYNNVQGISYIPFTAVNNGFPWIECGKDIVSYVVYDFEKSAEEGTDVYADKQFYVFRRNLKGIQALTDEYSAEGEEYQTEFITDLQTQLETRQTAENAVKNYTYSKAELDEKLENQVIVKSVVTLPTDWQEGVIYLIQGEVTVE